MSLVSLVLETYRHDPFYSPKKFIKDLGCSADDLASAILAVKASHNDILISGPYSQYWSSIKQAYCDNLLHAVNNQPAYPARIGLYPGVSCMFNCQFCGRREGTSFSNNLADSSVELFSSLLDEHIKQPHHQKIIRLSGGLEPTTNKNIGKIIKSIESVH